MARIPGRYIGSVLAIGNEDKSRDMNFKPIATGFMFGNVNIDPNNSERLDFSTFVVTNKHVINEREKDIYLRINGKHGNSAQAIRIPLINDSGVKQYYVHEEVDLAVIYVDIKLFKNESIKNDLILSIETLVSDEQIDKLGIFEGDEINVLGYPMGLVGYDKNYPLVRMGIISRIGDFKSGVENNIVVDCHVFPGNSGGPVIMSPRPYLGDHWDFHSKGQHISYLLGVVSGYLPYSEVAYSLQSGKPRIEFQENSGLAIVVPAKYIIECIENFVNYRVNLGGKIVRHKFPTS